MRGSDATTGSLFRYVDLEDRVPRRHPLRLIREIVSVGGSVSRFVSAEVESALRSRIGPADEDGGTA